MERKEVGLFSIPLLISFLLAIILYICVGNIVKINNFEMISSNYIEFVSVLVGFLITTITIVVGFFDKKIIKIIVNSKKEKILYINRITTIILGIVSVLFTFYLAAIFDSNTNEINKIPLSIIIFLTSNFIGYLSMSLIYFFGIAISVMQENSEEEKEIPQLNPEKIRNPNIKE